MDKTQRNLLLAAAAGAGLYFARRKLERSRNAISFRDRVVFITGGSRGLGLLLARRFAAEGARLALCARDPDELERAAEELRQYTDVLNVQCDVSKRTHVEDAVQTVRDHFGRIDVLVNNAGIITSGPMEHMREADFEEAMNVHFFGPLHVVQAVLPQMKRQGQGRIVNISSIGGKISVPHLLPYCASKFALVGYSDGLRAELAKDNILVTTVCPGLMRTGSPQHAQFKGQHRAEYAWFVISDSIPVIAMNADRAAGQIVEACRAGRAHIVLGAPAKLADKLHGLFPGLTADVLGLVTRLLPGPGGVGDRAVPGRESRSRITQSWLTALTQRAAARNNENG